MIIYLCGSSVYDLVKFICCGGCLVVYGCVFVVYVKCCISFLYDGRSYFCYGGKIYFKCGVLVYMLDIL